MSAAWRPKQSPRPKPAPLRASVGRSDEWHLAAQSLNGGWNFKYLPSSDAGGDGDFFRQSFDVAAWKTIPAPSHWKLHGFAEPGYGDGVKEGAGLYRRSVRAAKPWHGQRVFLRFDGVLYKPTAYVIR
jgi:beta-galactosidase/beta-glucuronidase